MTTLGTCLRSGWFWLGATTLFSIACGDSGDGPVGAVGGAAGSGASASGGSGGSVPTEPVKLNASDYTYQLTESPASLPLWTTPAVHKVRTNERAPSETHSGLRLSAARNEFEPVQLLLGPAAGNVKIDIAPFPTIPAARLTLAVAGYENGWEEHLTPLASGGSVTLSAAQATPVWLTVYVPKDAPAGEHTTTLTVTPEGGSAVAIPVKLYAFNFALPDQISFATQYNLGISGLIPSGGTVDDAKTLLFEHRMTPTSVTWPSGFNWNITWDSDANPARCEAFYDEPDEGAEYAIGRLAPKYINGEGWNGIGFPDSEIFQFVDNSTPRPGTFCGLSRGDHYGTTDYNAEWSQYLSALNTYLVSHNFANKVYYYVQNEPQDAEDDRLAAYLCRLTRAAAPNLRIAISEEPKPGIAEHPEGGCGYDIWIAHIRAYQRDYAWKRQREKNEQVWFYSLDHDPDPYFNPTKVEADGMHQRIIPWVAWGLRIRGWVYYDGGRFFDGSNPTVRAEMFREGYEDYEYLFLANGHAHPKVDATEIADATALSVASGLTSWNKSADALMALRYELGRYIEGSRTTLPTLQVDTGKRKRAAYYLNFQDPAGKPTAEPLVVEGKTYMKVGWQAYSESAGLGWSGEHISDPSIAKYGYDDKEGYSEVQKSYVYDDYGRDNLFEFALENGRYQITVGVGRPAKGYAKDPHNVVLEGNALVKDEVTTDQNPTIVRTATVDLKDGSVSLIVGGKSPTTNDFAYTFLAYMDIVPVD